MKKVFISIAAFLTLAGLIGLAARHAGTTSSSAGGGGGGGGGTPLPPVVVVTTLKLKLPDALPFGPIASSCPRKCGVVSSTAIEIPPCGLPGGISLRMEAKKE